MIEVAVEQLAENNTKEFALVLTYCSLLAMGDVKEAMKMLDDLPDKDVCGLSAVFGYLAINDNLEEGHPIKVIASTLARNIPIYYMARDIDELNELIVSLNISASCEIRHIMKVITLSMFCNIRL